MEATPESHNGTKGPSSPVVVEEQPISISALRSKFENLSAGGAGGIKTSTGKTWKRPDTGLSNLIPAPGWAGQSGQSRNGAGDSLARSAIPVPATLSGSTQDESVSTLALVSRPLPSEIGGKLLGVPTPILADPVSGSLFLPDLQADTRPTSPQATRRPAPPVPLKAESLRLSRSPSPIISEDGQRQSGPSSKERSVRSVDNHHDAELRDIQGGESSSAALRRAESAHTAVMEGLSPIGAMLKQSSAPSFLRTSTGGSSRSVNSLDTSLDNLSAPIFSTSPGDVMLERASTVAPILIPQSSRPVSPAPPQPNRANKPIPRPPPFTAQPEPEPPDAHSIPLPTPPPRPALPVRKPSLASHNPSAPFLPGNQPSSLPTEASGSFGTTVPPRLPSRSRASTLTQGTESRPSTPPPKLPARTGIIGGSHSKSLPIPPSRASPRPSTPQRDLDQPSIDNSSSPRRQGTLPRNTVFKTDEYQPPLPPVRNAHAAVASPPRREMSGGAATNDSEEDDEEDGPPAPGLTSTVKRTLDDYPDSSHANRRPPRFTPDVRVNCGHHVHSFAVFGRHVCTGDHQVRVYDTLMSDRPIFSVDLKDTGLDFRVKDPRVTTMCFRPTHDPADEGRYLWCGTKDGHLWELDIKLGQVSDTRAFAHGSAVVNIFRYKKYLLTLEESGKMNVFDTAAMDENGNTHYIPQLSRTVRVTDRFSFAALICGQLWISSGPTVRSTTNASSQGPTIRVYEPCTEGTMPPAKTLVTSEWTGAVTSATVMPMKPQVVYLGHEGGFMSIWDAEEYTCLQVLKISASDILALAGVGERLWAGNRKGQIHAYDVAEKPWSVTNVWTAHQDNPITHLEVDPWSPENSGRFVLWSSARDSLKAWDGLLSVDWTDKQLQLREPEYCTFRNVKLLVCSWNIDSAKPSDLFGSEANTQFLDQMLHSVDSPDIIVFGLQEVIPLTDKKLTAKTLLFGGRNKESGAMADKVSLAYRQWQDKLQTAVRMASAPDTSYIKVHSESLVGLFTCVFVKSAQRESLREIDITTVKRGIGGIYGNKGAIVARMVMDDTSLCFINVHLAAGQAQKASRTADLAAILEDKSIFPAAGELPFVHGGDGAAILDHEMVILNGDLNYRIDQRRENVISSIAAGDLPFLLEHDQLRKEMRNNRSFRLRNFGEAPITFPPTYKYNTGTDEYDTSEKRRIPAWCDRILYSKCPRIEPINYRRYEPTVSDHKPISAGFVLQVKAVDPQRLAQVRSDVSSEWARKEADIMGEMALAFEKLI